MLIGLRAGVGYGVENAEIQSVAANQHSRLKILVVDDEPMVCDAVEMMLSFDGHEVHTATSAAQALKCFGQTAFDLVITDYAMPQVRGDELAIRLKQRSPQTPVVMITAHAEVLLSTGTPLPGIALVISKPFMIDTLREAIRQTCPHSA